uniref:Cytoskeleton-related protein n=1 Tax=Avihepevirus magniiecur TaxID=1678144 RepID=A0A5S9H2D6_9VIRU|nr:cytoskeleton-related protein [Avian hepatitis E virus]
MRLGCQHCLQCQETPVGCRRVDCCSCLQCAAGCQGAPKRSQPEIGAANPAATTQHSGALKNALKEPSAQLLPLMLSPRQVLARYQM